MEAVQRVLLDANVQEAQAIAAAKIGGAGGAVVGAAIPAQAAGVTPQPATPPQSMPAPTEASKQRYSQIFNVLHTNREFSGVSREKVRIRVHAPCP